MPSKKPNLMEELPLVPWLGWLVSSLVCLFFHGQHLDNRKECFHFTSRSLPSEFSTVPVWVPSSRSGQQPYTHRFHPFRELVSTTLRLLWVHSSCSSSKIGWKGKGSRTIVSAWDKIFQLLCEGDLRPITDWVNSFLCSLKDFVVVSLNCFLWSGSHPVKENPLVSKPLVDDCQSRATLLLRRIAPSKWCQGTNEYKRLEFPL